MDKIKFIPETLAKLQTPATIASLQALVKSAPEMLRMECFSNLDASNSEDIPIGVIMYFPRKKSVCFK